MNLAAELQRLVTDARAHGCTTIDLAAIERLLHRWAELQRMVVYGLDP